MPAARPASPARVTPRQAATAHLRRLRGEVTGIGRARALVVGAILLAVFAGGVVVGALGAYLVSPPPPPSPAAPAASPVAVAALPPASAPPPGGPLVATQTPTASPTPVATQVPTAGPTPVARTIVGLVTALSGPPVAGVQIRGRPASSDRQPVPLPEATAVTNANGAYVLRVNTWTEQALGASVLLALEITPPPGFVVRGVARALGGWNGYPGVAFLDEEMEAGPVDIALVRGHVLEGRVTSGLTGAPLPGARVDALRPRDLRVVGGIGGPDQPAAAVTTDAAGRYSLTVRAGTYVISVSGPEPARAELPQRRFWSADPGVFEASSVTVDRDLAGLDVALVPVSQISGVVRAGLSPYVEADGVRVVAHAAASTPCCKVVGRATTATPGALGGTFLMYVPEGLYRILFEPPAGSPYASQWWQGAAGFATATDVRADQGGARLEVELARVAR